MGERQTEGRSPLRQSGEKRHIPVFRASPHSVLLSESAIDEDVLVHECERMEAEDEQQEHQQSSTKSPKRPVSDAMLEADFAMSIERELESAIQIGMAELAASQAYQAEVDATIRTAIDDSENSKETDQYARDLEQQIERDTVLETELEIEEDFGSSALLNDREVTNLIDQELQRLGIED
eukprot:TRINITY_DN3626_c0_g1_i1.p2 TRINITY_DN3626_c0_g1~~TRINITY_DN3626_c0_g1_i1.p2  ORF type:complete len:189 (-),score=49.49 TRINITY_DN3626_c0_g1_i1:902-1441(-)